MIKEEIEIDPEKGIEALDEIDKSAKKYEPLYRKLIRKIKQLLS